jgi:hypothetical protein
MMRDIGKEGEQAIGQIQGLFCFPYTARFGRTGETWRYRRMGRNGNGDNKELGHRDGRAGIVSLVCT